MKRYNIAVMVLDLTGDYSLEVFAGVTDYFKDKDVNVLFTQVKLPDLPYGTFEYQYWTGHNLFASNSVDAVIVVSSFFVSSVSVSQFIEYLKIFSHKPIISIGVELPFENSCCIKTDCEQTYRAVFKHLTEKHGCKKIAFMSANDTKSQEARERYDAYLKMLKEFNMPFDSSLLFNGNFTITSAETAFKQFTSKSQIKFDAVLAANDLMAFGCINELSRLGVKIPNDVKVIGFDDSYQALNVEPSLSTISQQIYSQGMIAAELAYNAVQYKENPKVNYVPLKPYYRQSCGCVPAQNFEINYINDDGVVVPKGKFSHNKTVNEYLTANNEKRNIYYLLDVLQMSESLTDLFTRFKQIMFSIDMRRIALCLYDAPISHKKGEIFSLPDEVELAVVIDREHEVEIISPKIRFDPHEKLLPEDVFETDYAQYVMESIFYGERQYGYALYKLGQKNYSLSSIYIKAISNALANAYEYTRKKIENENLSIKNEELRSNNDQLSMASKTDELTQIYNRRGFMLMGQQVLQLSHSVIKKGIVIFCDMDGLKKINDTYGHKMGDRAIVAEAEALKTVFKRDEVIGRLSGDEFAVISPVNTLREFPALYKKILKECKSIAKREKFPFELSVSAGAVEFTHSDTDLQVILSRADAEQYKEKRKKHSERR